jgi:hypothetical protein
VKRTADKRPQAIKTLIPDPLLKKERKNIGSGLSLNVLSFKLASRPGQLQHMGLEGPVQVSYSQKKLK